MANKTSVKIGDRLSIRITEKIDKDALEWLNKQDNRSRSIIRLITAFAKIEKTKSGEFIKLLMESMNVQESDNDKLNSLMSDTIGEQLSDIKEPINKSNVSDISTNMSDNKIIKSSDNSTMTDNNDGDIYSEVFGSLDIKNNNEVLDTDKNVSNILNALKSIKR